MKKTLDHGAQGRFLVPEMALARTVSSQSVFLWLVKGWEDVKALKTTSLLYAAWFLLIGLMISFGFYRWQVPYLILPALSGFLLVGPAIALGFYEGSIRRQQGQPFHLHHALLAFRRCRYPILGMGIAQVFLFMVWIRLSFTLFAVAFPGVMPQWVAIFERATTIEGLHFAIMITALGGLFATLIFFTGAFSLPLMMDRQTVLIPALLTSAYAVFLNLKVMLLWASLIVLIMFLGLISGIGLLMVFPLVGHATWHAYQAVLGENEEG